MIQLVCSWKTLMQLAHAAGQAELAAKTDLTEKNILAWKEAVARHDEYRDLCLKADRMLGPL